MINICESYANDYNIKFNGTKSKLTAFVKETKYSSIPNICVANEPVEIVDSVKYLGHVKYKSRLNAHVDDFRRDF